MLRSPLHGPFRFMALDVETADRRRGSICQVGVAGVRNDGTLATWSTYLDPGPSDWSCSFVHGITAGTVRGAPRFDAVLPVLEALIGTRLVFQHSSFDKAAIAAACTVHGLDAPDWLWRDSLRVARRAWPELKGNGGHGLASLKRHLGLNFRHHDGEEDARAAAEIVLRAEQATGLDFAGAEFPPLAPAAATV
ncbi:exonuclease domain-containing protein [Jannaschia formosa]|uniref:exonuclease domain-containing protein n=1 Tax=Jannaschia formosa TaxID=2259592 RepID=UPI000E1C09F8|nr:exonuclease domain-containing protein [Jannaschia formosa]TFL17372.1 exonuclease [Jannaschia formosa]